MDETLTAFLQTLAPDHTAIQADMAELASEEGFPIIGREAGAVLQMLATLTEARAIFEFGSGFGYSATWFLRGMHPQGQLILTELDPDEIDQGRTFLERAGWKDRFRYEQGDALEIIDRYPTPFDIVLIDHQKSRYPEAFEAIQAQLPVGAVVIADNVMRGPVGYEELLGYLQGDHQPERASSAGGLVAYLDRLNAAENWVSAILPVGNGLAVSVKHRGTLVDD